MANPSRRKKPSFKDEPIDVAELAGMSNMKGMLSFLETKPEDYAKLFGQSTSLPCEPEPPEVVPIKQDSEMPTGGVSILPTVGTSEEPTAAISIIPTVGVYEMHPVSVSKLPTVGDSTSPPVCVSEMGTGIISEVHTEGISEVPTVPISDPVGLSQPSVPRKEPRREMPPVDISKAPTVFASETPPVGTSDALFILELTTPPVVDTVRHVKLRPVRSIQDGLTPGEFLLLTEMFKAGLPINGSKDRQLKAAGYRTLSDKTGQDPKTVKRNRQTLLQKFCLQEITANTFTEAAQFRILHFESILAEWRRRRLYWVNRSGRTVELSTGTQPVGTFDLPSVGVSELPPVGISKVSSGGTPVVHTEDDSEAPVGNAPTESVGVSPTVPGGVSPGYLSVSSSNKSSSASTLVATAVLGAFGFIDDDALKTLIHKCRENAPDATDEEIAELGAMTARRVVQMRNVNNHVGLLIAQTAKCFLGEPFALYRRQNAERDRQLAEMMRPQDQGREEEDQ
jgi:hypothetical protein